jgi:ubiquitin C-terminal hydrolase
MPQPFDASSINTKISRLLNPNISIQERKSIEAWEREMKLQSSAISDLFVGQQSTTIECQQCKNKTYAFENFYTLSLPLPYN